MRQNNFFSKLIKFIIYILFVFLLNQANQFFFSDLTCYADVFFILPWAFAYLYGGYDYLFLMIPSAIFRDWLFSSLLGLSLMIGLITSFLAKHFLQIIWQRKFIFLPLQVLLLSFIAQILENLILNLNIAIQFNTAFSGQSLWPTFNLEYLIQTVVFTLIIGCFIYRVLPFFYQKKDRYAEDVLKNKESF